MAVPEEPIANFFRLLHPADDDEGFLGVFRLEDRVTKSFATSDLDAAAAYAASIAPSYSVYVCNGLQRERLDRCTRGGQDSVIGLPGFCIDIDVDHPGRNHHNLPKTFAEAHTLIRTSGFEPSAIVNTGYGLQAWYLFRETWSLPNDVERQRAKDLAMRFHLHFASSAGAFGWHLDHVATLGHAFRIPGTFNHKHGKHVPVRLEANYAAL